MSCVVLLRWFKHVQDDDAERLVFYEKCMSIIVIIITPNGDWNYGYTAIHKPHTIPKQRAKQTKTYIWLELKMYGAYFFPFCGPYSHCCTN